MMSTSETSAPQTGPSAEAWSRAAEAMRDTVAAEVARHRSLARDGLSTEGAGGRQAMRVRAVLRALRLLERAIRRLPAPPMPAAAGEET